MHTLIDAPTRELLDLIARWIHLIAGIMWVGNSMLFNWLDRNLEKRAGADARHVGVIWMVHSGGFYEVEKKSLAPAQMPAMLHWFKWQAYTTWMSGIALLVLVYYMGGGALLVDPSVSVLTPGTATHLGLATVFGGLLVYDLMWRTPIAKFERFTTFLSLALLAGAVAFLTSRLSGRAAFIHVGALLGTCMAGNVFLHIIPSQRELVAATVSGRDQDPRLSWRAKQRSIHNNYMTFPLLFLMLSSHFSSTFGHAHRAVVLGVLMVAGASVRHVLNIRFTFPAWKPTLAAVLTASIVALYLLLVPRGGVDAMAAFRGGPPVTFGEARTVLQQRCVTCHSATPKDAVFTTAPNGVVFDAPEQIHLYADRIMARAVLAKTMPLANRTGMTDEERAILGRWVAQGARVE
ncbi:MAG: urate hydroxylase PuuD [Myxococcales bacterium]|nr:urate hydroxylase PuuD [Myxococcales bacterium]